MELEYNSKLNNICKGCLSADREITTVYDAEYKRIFEELLNSMDHINQELLLCWECSAKIKSIIRFRNRVRMAHDCLIRYMICQTAHLSSLSTLTKIINHQNDYDDKISITEDIIQKPEHPFVDEVNYSTKKTTYNFLSETASSMNSAKFTEVPVSNTANFSPNESQPIFVKIEDSDLALDGDFYADESIEHSVEDKNGMIDLKADTSLADAVSRKKKKSKKKKKTKIKYDASDDEPLKPKKVKRGRPKKEEAGTATKRRVKREKPAGVVTNSRVHRNLQQLNVAEGQIEMVVLSWEEVEAERERARASAAFTRHAHRCADCVLGFNHRVKLDAHMAKHKPEAGPAECAVCRVRCRDHHALVAHKRRHRVRWRCVTCGETASRAAVAADHAARAHGAAPTHTCRACGDTLESLAKLRNHMKNHAERQKCELCGKTFRDRTSLRSHLFIHGGEKEYACPQCDKRFLFKKAMEVHLVTHSAPAQLYCLECDMTFKNRMSYYQHKKYNLKHVDPAMLKHRCAVCDKRFLQAARLQEHTLAVHLKVTPIRCTLPDCDFACSSRPVLRTHVRMVHRNGRAARNHVCHTCGKAYTTKKTLEGHMRSHTGERPFHCALCPSTFSYEAALYNHNKLVHLKSKAGRTASANAGIERLSS